MDEGNQCGHGRYLSMPKANYCGSCGYELDRNISNSGDRRSDGGLDSITKFILNPKISGTFAVINGVGLVANTVQENYGLATVGGLGFIACLASLSD